MRGLNLRLDRVVYKHRYMRKPVQDRFFVFLRLSIIGQRTDGGSVDGGGGGGM